MLWFFNNIFVTFLHFCSIDQANLPESGSHGISVGTISIDLVLISIWLTF